MDDMDLSNVIVLNDENGNEVRFEFLDLIEYEGKEYVVLLPMEDDDGEVVILEVEYDESSDMETYTPANDAVYTAVSELSRAKFREEFNFED